MESINAHGANSKRVCSTYMYYARIIIIIVMRIFSGFVALIPSDISVNTLKRNLTIYWRWPVPDDDKDSSLIQIDHDSI